MPTLAALLGQALLLLCLAPLAQGLPGWLVARLEEHPAPPPLQEYHDLWKWLRRATGNEQAASVALGAALTAGLLTPTVVRQAPLDGYGDLIVLSVLLMLVDLALAQHEARSSRFSPAGPILLLALLALAGSIGSLSAPTLAGAGGIGTNPAEMPLFLSIGCLALAERRRLAPANGVVGVGAYGLATASEASSSPGTARLALLVAQMVLLSLLANLFLPWGLGNAGHDSLLRLLGGGALYFLRVVALGCLVAWVEMRLSGGQGGRALMYRLALLLAVLGLLAGGISHA